MEQPDLSQLVTVLRSPGLRVRTGIWLMPLSLIGHEPNEAARLGITALDIRHELISTLPVGARFVALDSNSLLQLLNEVLLHKQQSDCVLIYNIDLLLARLTHQQRVDFWQFVFIGFVYRPTALLLVMPEIALSLLPADEKLNFWKQDKRLAISGRMLD